MTKDTDGFDAYGIGDEIVARHPNYKDGMRCRVLTVREATNDPDRCDFGWGNAYSCVKWVASRGTWTKTTTLVHGRGIIRPHATPDDGCRNCGTTYNGDLVFCPRCGVPCGGGK